MERIRWEVVAPGRPYHAAYVPLDGSPPGVIRHDHVDYVELLGVLEGTGDHHVDGAGRTPLDPGTVALLRPGDVHAITGTLAFVNIAFPVATWRGFLATAGLPDWPAGGVPAVAAPVATVAETFWTALVRYADRPTGLDLVRFLGTAVGLLDPAPGPAAEPDWLTAACEAFGRDDEHLRAGLPALVRLAAVSPSQLARCMRRYRGTTPVGYVTALRLQRAAELLATTTLPAGQVAARCGFASQAYFTRLFTARHGLPPAAFRSTARTAVAP
ncbi:MAG: AraC family transcriptional regulator [Mycobacteriales bacterium]